MASTLDDDLLASFAESPLHSPAFKALCAARQQCEADLMEAFEPSPVAMNTHLSSHVSPDTESNLLLPFGDNTSSVALHSANEFTQLAEHLAAGHAGEFDESHDEDLLDDMFEPEHKAGSLGFSDSNSDSEEEDASNECVASTQSTPAVSQIGALVGTSGRTSSSKSLSIASLSTPPLLSHSGKAPVSRRTQLSVTSTPASTGSVDSNTLSVVAAFQGKYSKCLALHREEHRAMSSFAFAGYSCPQSCKFKGLGASCLESGFDRAFFFSLHAHTYGKNQQEIQREEHRRRDVKAAIHQLIWELRKPLNVIDHFDRKFEVPEWRLGGPNGRQVCQAAFRVAVGGTANSHRQALMLTLKGSPPGDYLQQQKVAAAVRQAMKPKGERMLWAINWWRRHLLWSDWLPNELKIQYRGPYWSIVYDDFYYNEAKRVNMVLKPARWKRLLGSALTALQAEYFPSATDGKLTLSRSARHSKFPECSFCQIKRGNYKRIASNPRSTSEQIAAAYKELADHAAEWQGDREAAYTLRQQCSAWLRTGRYQVDDKCGSFWQQLPVSWTGRDTKDNAKARYKFSVHANVVCGERGHKRFTFVPKNIATGANFGLTNLLMTIFLAVASGNIAPHVEDFYRHTDGGSDNVAVVSHFVHWLLIYIGTFQNLTWFRFKAGHSHTETADRLFAIMKRLFEADGAHRVNPIHCFPQLIEKLEKEFAAEIEACTFHWDFANWDFRKMMQEMHVVSSKLKGINSKMVYKYSYVESLHSHGNVLVQYKSNIQWRGSAREAEWSPIATVVKEMPQADDSEELEEVQCNVSKPKGVRFVLKPPDLRIFPEREAHKKDIDKDANKHTPEKQCRAVLSARSSDLPPASLLFWKALEQFHKQCADAAERVPELPYCINTDQGTQFDFDGTPRSYLDVMKKISLRFPRPLLGENPFHSSPAPSWEEAKARMMQRSSEVQEQPSSTSLEDELRDPRRENTVEDEENTSTQRRKDLQGLAAEEFAEETDTRVEDVLVGKFYLIELDEAEYGVRLGLGVVQEKGPNAADTGNARWKVGWFRFKTKAGWKAKNPFFEQHKIRGQQQTDLLEIASFRLLVDDSDLTKQGLLDKETTPKFRTEFAAKVLAFASNQGLNDAESEEEDEAFESDDEESDEGEDDDGVEADDGMQQERGVGDSSDSASSSDAEDAAADSSEEEAAASSKRIQQRKNEAAAAAKRKLARAQPKNKAPAQQKASAKPAASSTSPEADLMDDDDEEEELVADDDEPPNNSADLSDEEPAPKKSRKNKGKAPAATSDKKVSACEPSSASCLTANRANFVPWPRAHCACPFIH